jgi:release factor glutamine methyltransferase
MRFILHRILQNEHLVISTSQAVITIHQTLREASRSLQVLPHSTPDLEAAILLCHLLAKPRSFLYAWPDAELDPTQTARFRRLIERRLQGEPIAHIIGIREFWSLALKVSPATLIPRPETELLVERGLEIIQDLPRPRVADLGTGSGAVALAIASERPDSRICATDLSPAALQIARENADRLGLSNVEFRQGNWFEALPILPPFDLILSNPPYIPDQDPHLDQGDLPKEPRSALISGRDGLDDLRCIIGGAGDHLPPGGWLLLEHGFDQAQSVRRLLRQAGFHTVSSRRDLAGHERMSEGRWANP